MSHHHSQSLSLLLFISYQKMKPYTFCQCVSFPSGGKVSLQSHQLPWKQKHLSCNTQNMSKHGIDYRINLECTKDPYNPASWSWDLCPMRGQLRIPSGNIILPCWFHRVYLYQVVWAMLWGATFFFFTLVELSTF